MAGAATTQMPGVVAGDGQTPVGVDLNHFTVLFNSMVGGKRITVYTDKEKQHGWVWIQPVSHQFELSYQEIEQAIAHSGLAVTKDRMQKLNQLLVEIRQASEAKIDLTQRKFEPIEVSVGKPAVQGTDGWCQWFVDEPDSKELRFRPDAQGRIDFREMNKVINVNIDDALVQIHAPTEGQAGFDVFGTELPARNGETRTIARGKGVRFDEETGTVYAEMAGHVGIEGGAVVVSPLYSVPGNLDFSVGNINFRGAVEVGKDVNEGFTIRATGNIHVNGTANQAFLYSGGDVDVRGGITAQGGRGLVEAQGKVSAKYIVNARIDCKGDILVASEILNSEITCAGKIIMPTGRITGGSAVALGGMELGDVGAKSGTKTVLNVSIDFFNTNETRAIDQEIEAKEKRIAKLEGLLGPYLKDRGLLNTLAPDKMEEVIGQTREMDNLQAELGALHEERQRALTPFAEALSDEIIIHGTIHSGADIRIDNARQVFTETVQGPAMLKPNYARGTIAVHAIQKQD